MNYDAKANKTPKMPNLGKGTECIKTSSFRPKKT